MELKLVAAVAVIGAVMTDARPAAGPQLSGMPWLHGLANVRITDEPDALAVEVDEDLACAGPAYLRYELVADVAPAAGKEVVRASLVEGIVVADREDRPLAWTPGYACEGSADEIVALAAGTAFMDPTIALAMTRGGHAEQATDLALFRVGFGGRLDPVFTATVEDRRGERVRLGAVWMIPEGLVYRRPGGGTSLWTFDPVARAYLYRASFDASGRPPHAEPPPIR